MSLYDRHDPYIKVPIAHVETPFSTNILTKYNLKPILLRI